MPDNICLWDWATGNLERKVHLDTTNTPWAMALSPDERKVFVGQEAHQAIICDVRTGKFCGPPLEIGNAVDGAMEPRLLDAGDWNLELFRRVL